MAFHKQNGYFFKIMLCFVTLLSLLYPEMIWTDCMKKIENKNYKFMDHNSGQLYLVD